MQVKVLIVCVDYLDYLQVTLPRVLEKFKDVRVITCGRDENTQHYVINTKAALYVTDVFYASKAEFNKGAAIEEVLEWTEYDGWYLILDADILLPQGFCIPNNLHPANLYGMKRDHGKCRAQIGYFQLFNSTSPYLEKKPWYETCWKHAGNSDSCFYRRWPVSERRWLPGKLIHLGKPGQDWCGRTPEGRRALSRYWILRKRVGNAEAERIKI